MPRPRLLVHARILDRAISDPETVPDADLLASLLGLVGSSLEASDLVNLLKQYGSFAELLSAPAAQLRATSGLDEIGAILLKAMHAAATRYCRSELFSRPILQNWSVLLKYLRTAMAYSRTEEFKVLFLDPGHMLITDEIMWTGTTNHAPVYPCEVVRRALELHATFLILAHNHPSGDPWVSPEDVSTTRELQQMAAAFSIQLIDHLIICRDKYTSLRNTNALINNGGHARPVTGMACLPYPAETEPVTSDLPNHDSRHSSNHGDRTIVEIARVARMTHAVADNS